MKAVVRDATIEDAVAIADIYEPIVRLTAISFEEEQGLAPRAPETSLIRSLTGVDLV